MCYNIKKVPTLLKPVESKNEAHNMKQLRLFFENIPLWVINLISIISGIIAIVTEIKGVFVFFSQNGDTPWDNSQLLILIIVLPVLFILVMSLQILENRKRSRVRVQCIAQSFHILAHRFRDEIFQMLRDYENNELTQTLLIKHLMVFFEKSLNALCSIMSDFTGENVGACIQMIRYPHDGQIDHAEVSVFCRSDNSDERRKNQDQSQESRILKKDPILSQMVGPDAIPYFSCPDLREYRKSHANDKAFVENFRNSLISSYRGVFIVPIRIANSDRPNRKDETPFHVVGFLCLDTTSTKVFLDKHENNYAQIVKTFSDIFYVAISIFSDFENRM